VRFWNVFSQGVSLSTATVASNSIATASDCAATDAPRNWNASPWMLLILLLERQGSVGHGIYAATAVSGAVTGVNWATVERNALRIATMILRPLEVSW
jgi:hypothetical protein